MFHDTTGRNSYGVHVNDPDTSVAQCLTYDPALESGEANRRYQECSTVTIQHLEKNDRVFLKEIYTARTLLTRTSLTFWIMVKL